MEPIEIILLSFSLLFLVFIIIIWPRPIDEVRDDRNRLLFTIYQSGRGFQVNDHQGITKRRIYFKTYVDVEAYVKRRVNSWNDLTK